MSDALPTHYYITHENLVKLAEMVGNVPTRHGFSIMKRIMDEDGVNKDFFVPIPPGWVPPPTK